MTHHQSDSHDDTSRPTTEHPKHAQVEHDVVDLIRERWSPRAFDTTRKVTTTDLWRVFEGARWAPSSSNEQPWRFVVAHRERSPESFQALLATLTPPNQTWAKAAPVLVLAVVKLNLDKTGDANHHAYYDTGQAVAFLTLQAQSQRMAVRQMAGFSRDAAREVCRVPDGFEPTVVMAIGYPGVPEALENEKHRAAEQTPRRRHSTADFVFDGAWDSPF